MVEALKEGKKMESFLIKRPQRGQLTPDFELNSKIQTSVGTSNATLRGPGAKKKSIFF
jgi:hypothetical protein